MDTKVIREKQDLTYLSWSKIRASSGTGGSFLKSRSDISGVKVYYKLSNYDNFKGIIGHESVNEIIVDRLLTILGIEHLHYQLIHADIDLDRKIQEAWVCASENYRAEEEDKQALDVFFESQRLDEENALDFCVRMGWNRY
ncbi:MAG: hypothetical protein IJ091_05405, partial [Oscillospiraceae bacterium]|nr:hypothetical protein [Oscillospiraceae bacterium]